MEFIPLARGARVVLRYTVAGQDMLNVQHVQKQTGDFSAAFLGTICEMWRDEFWTTIRPEVAIECSLADITATAWHEPHGEQETLVVNEAGTRAGGVVSNMVSPVLRLWTGRAGRSYRGRLFVPGMGEERVTGNLLINAARDTMIDAGVAIAEALILELVTWGVASFIGDKEKRETALFTPYTTIGMRSQVRTQKRRMPNDWV